MHARIDHFSYVYRLKAEFECKWVLAGHGAIIQVHQPHKYVKMESAHSTQRHAAWEMTAPLDKLRNHSIMQAGALNQRKIAFWRRGYIFETRARRESMQRRHCVQLFMRKIDMCSRFSLLLSHVQNLSYTCCVLNQSIVNWMINHGYVPFACNMLM